MNLTEAIATIRDAYEAERAEELIAAAYENESAAIELAEVIQAEVDDNGELIRHSLSSQAISEAEAALA